MERKERIKSLMIRRWRYLVNMTSCFQKPGSGDGRETFALKRRVGFCEALSMLVQKEHVWEDRVR